MSEPSHPWKTAPSRQYKKKRLRREDLDEDPFVQWERWVDEGAADGQREPSAMALATADGSGRPTVRMVLMKGFDSQGIVFGTNYGSRKGRDIEENPQASVLFYWPTLERQARATGRIEKTNAAESDALFNNRPPGSRLAARASHQSEPIAGREELIRRLEEETERFPGEEIPRPHFWGGYRLIPDEFEFWQGGEHRLHDRFTYIRADGGWEIQRLMP